MDKPKGATIIENKLKNEVGAKLKETKKATSFDEFIDTMSKQEIESIKPLSGDLEVITNISAKDLAQLQKEKRLHGYDDKTKTGLVLKVAFIDKKKKLAAK